MAVEKKQKLARNWRRTPNKHDVSGSFMKAETNLPNEANIPLRLMRAVDGITSQRNPIVFDTRSQLLVSCAPRTDEARRMAAGHLSSSARICLQNVQRACIHYVEKAFQ